ncbi:MAG: hypothetical protein QG573_2566, partial [Acidobacteriota bacterium]|nr:hypothetical protein [Acidobacteriota bacterium]
MIELRASNGVCVWALCLALGFTAACSPKAEEPAAATPPAKGPVRQLGPGEGAVTIIAWAG